MVGRLINYLPDSSSFISSTEILQSHHSSRQALSHYLHMHVSSPYWIYCNTYI